MTVFTFTWGKGRGGGEGAITTTSMSITTLWCILYQRDSVDIAVTQTNRSHQTEDKAG